MSWVRETKNENTNEDTFEWMNWGRMDALGLQDEGMNRK